jgi:hypothetical protein
MRVAPLCFEIGLRARDKERPGEMQSVQALEVEIAPVHHVKGARLGQQFVEHIDVVPLAVGDVNEARNVAAQIDQRVQLDRRLGRTKRRPRKQRQAQIDRCGIQGVDGIFQIHAKGLVDIKSARDSNQVLSELGIDAPVACFVGVGKRAPGNRSANTQVVKLRMLGPKARFDVAQALAVAELGKRHAAKLIRATEIAHPMIAVVARDNAPESLPRQMIHQLREHQLADVHAPRSLPRSREDCAVRRSNRRHAKNGTLIQQISELPNSRLESTGH